MPAHHLVAAADAAVGDDAAAGAAKVVVLVKREALRAVASPPRNRVAPKLKGHSVRKAKDVVVKAAKAGEVKAAEKEFTAALEQARGSAWALYGLEQAAKARGDAAAQSRAAAELAKAWRGDPSLLSLDRL